MQGAFRRGDRDRARVCKELLDMVRIGHFFEAADIGPDIGPTREAVSTLWRCQDGCAGLSKGEGVLLRVAFDIWNGAGKTTLPDLMQHLPPALVQSVAELLVAIASGAPSYIDEWEKKWVGYDPAANFFAGA